jgi:hypothetical protein
MKLQSVVVATIVMFIGTSTAVALVQRSTQPQVQAIALDDGALAVQLEAAMPRPRSLSRPL